MAHCSATNDITFRLSRSRRSVPRARALLHAVLGGWDVGQETLDNAELVLSELVTNALRVPAPGDRQVGVRISRSVADGLLRIEVSDAGGGRPEVREPGGCCSSRRSRTAGVMRRAPAGSARRCSRS